MTVQLEVWQLLSLAVTLVGAFATVLKLLLAQQQKHWDFRFDGLEARSVQDAGQWQRVERELLALKADLPMSYVRREDYIRGQSVIEAKLDGLATKIENAQLRQVFLGGAKNVS